VFVHAGLVPAIHVLRAAGKTWMPAQASLRSLRKLGCKRGHDGGEAVVNQACFALVLPLAFDIGA